MTIPKRQVRLSLKEIEALQEALKRLGHCVFCSYVMISKPDTRRRAARALRKAAERKIR